MRTAVVVLMSAGLLSLGACRKSTTTTATEAPSSDDAPVDDTIEDEVVGSTHVDKQLPQELIAELRLAGDGVDGRLVTLAPSFIATAACSDCGAPSYLRFVAVRCSDERHCEVLTDVCSGKIGREGDTFAIELRAVEGAAADASAVCAGYTGTFEIP